MHLKIMFTGIGTAWTVTNLYQKATVLVLSLEVLHTDLAFHPVHAIVCVCLCVCVFLYTWFMRTQMCIITWVLQRKHGS